MSRLVRAQTNRDVTNLIIEWKVENLSLFFYERVIISPTFTAGDDITWRLAIRPRYRKDSELWLFNETGNLETISCSIKAEILDSDGEPSWAWKKTPWDCRNLPAAYMSFNTQKYFQCQENDNFTFRVELVYSPVISTRSALVSDCGTETPLTPKSEPVGTAHMDQGRYFTQSHRHT
jgi:hypothetical protein